MRSRRTIASTLAFAALLSALSLCLPATQAVAGQYVVGACQSDRLNFNTRAFVHELPSTGMLIRRACNPNGGGMRGLITSNNSSRRGGPVRVPRGAAAIVRIHAPAGTLITAFEWTGRIERSDCRYALQIWADGPELPRAILVRNFPPNHGCTPPDQAQAAKWDKKSAFSFKGAQRIVQRVLCKPPKGQAYCSGRRLNYIQTQQAKITIADEGAPAAAIVPDTPLARGEWVRGVQLLNYDASDNVGVRSAEVIGGGLPGGSHPRPCSFALPETMFADPVPCPNGAGQVEVRTMGLQEGTMPVVVRAADTAGNVGESAPITARVDNTPPSRVDISVEGGEGWRNKNDFGVGWTNPAETDRAPIVAALYKFCAEACTRGEQTGESLTRFGIQVPAPGTWKLSVRLRDGAGNESEAAESAPVTLRYDPDPPVIGFEAHDASDPTLVAVEAKDSLSGVADGAVEISPTGSNVWQPLVAQRHGDRLTARIDDLALPPGSYVLRARSLDAAGNEAWTDRRLNGEPMALTLPLRRPTRLEVGLARQRLIRKTIRRNGKRRVVHRRVTVMRPVARVRGGRHVKIVGTLTDPAGQPIAAADLQVLFRSSVSPEQPIASVRTDPLGRFSYTTPATTSGWLRVALNATPHLLPATAEASVAVPAETTLNADRRRLLNGQAVTFTGRLRALPAPGLNKLVEVQVLLSGRWQTFRTLRTDAAGSWKARYRFRRTRGLVRYRFRARLPQEAGYPFDVGGSRAVEIRVRGR